MRGLERHAHNADAHDLLARICVDRGELEQAFDEWDMVLRLAPHHVGRAEGDGLRPLQAGEARGGGDASERGRVARTRPMRRSRRRSAWCAGCCATRASPGTAPARRAPPSSRRRSGAWRRKRISSSPMSSATASRPRCSLNSDGLVTAGAYVTADGVDVAQEVGSQLSGVRDDAQRAVRHLDLGEWKIAAVRDGRGDGRDRAGAGRLDGARRGVARDAARLRAARARPVRAARDDVALGGRMSSPFEDVLASLIRHRGVLGCLVVGRGGRARRGRERPGGRAGERRRGARGGALPPGAPRVAGGGARAGRPSCSSRRRAGTSAPSGARGS